MKNRLLVLMSLCVPSGALAGAQSTPGIYSIQSPDGKVVLSYEVHQDAIPHLNPRSLGLSLRSISTPSSTFEFSALDPVLERDDLWSIHLLDSTCGVVSQPDYPSEGLQPSDATAFSSSHSTTASTFTYS